MDSLIAAIDAESAIGLGLAVFSVVGGLLIPFIYLFLQHQRKMAAYFNPAIAHRDEDERMERIESELKELREGMNQLIRQNELRLELQDRSGPPRMPNPLR